MRRFFALIFLLTTLPAITVGQRTSDRDEANLVGPVKTVAERTGFTPTDTDETGDRVKYDPRGNEIERVMVSDFGEVMGKRLQTFDDSGVLDKTLYLDAKGKLREETRYKYADGRLAEILRYDSNGVLREKTSRSYDRAGLLVEETYFDPSVARAKTVFRNDNGNAVEVAFFLKNGEKAIAPVGPCLGAHRVTLRYDAKGRVIAKAVFEPDGSEKKSWTYEYNDKGDLSTVLLKSGSTKSVTTYSYEHDPVGNWIKRKLVNEGEDGMLELMLSATGKKVRADELTKMKESARITRVTSRQIAYY